MALRFIVLALALAVLALASPGAARTAVEDGVQVIGVDELRRLQSSPRRILIVDVRTAEEFQENHIKDAVNVPLTEIERRFAEIPREGLVVLY